jgi:imidazolonepropionase-like amidohydrolase
LSARENLRRLAVATIKVALMLVAGPAVIASGAVAAQDAAQNKAAQDDPRTTVLRAARLLDVRNGQYTEHAVVVVSSGRIESVGSDASAIPAGARIVDLGDRTLLPGLIDAHTHILIQGDATDAEYDDQILKEYPAHRVARAVRALKIALEHGFTTMRDLETEGAGYGDVALRDAVDEGVIPGPHLQVAGPALSTTGTYPILHYRPDWSFPTGVMICDGADGCRRAVREQISYGTDWVKVYANTGRPRLTDDGYIDTRPNWTAAELAAIVSEAHARGRRVAAHATSDTGTRMAIAAGVDSIEHGDSIRPEMAAEMAHKSIFYCPTQTVLYYQAAFYPDDAMLKEIEKIAAKSLANCRKAGVKVVFGTDAGGFPWTEINQAKEFRYEVQLGMTPLEAIRSATAVAADALGLSGQAGLLAKGAHADIVAVPGDPLQDVGVLERVDFVMKGGRVVVEPGRQN